MVFELGRDLHALINLVLAYREYLCRASFARDMVSQSPRDTLGCATRTMYHINHGIHNGAPISRGNRDVLTFMQGERFLRIGWHLHMIDHARLNDLALVGKNGHGPGHLQGSGLHITLTDTGYQGFPWKPSLLAGLKLPFRRRIDSCFFPVYVDPGFFSKTKPFHVMVHTINPQAQCKLIEINVTGLGDGKPQIHPPVPAAFPIAVGMITARQTEKPGAIHPTAHRDLSVFQPGQGHKRLDCGPRRVDAPQNPVIQGPVGGVLQAFKLSPADALDKWVGVETGIAHHRQNMAARRLDGY